LRAQRVGYTLASLALLAGGAAQAGAPVPFSPDILLDWKGLRNELHDLGIDIRLAYTSESATNVQGGEREAVTYDDQVTLLAALDLQKLLGLSQATLQLSITDRNGQSLSSVADLDSLQQVQEIYGRGRTWRVTQFWYEQRYLHGRLDLKAGRITEGEDFAAFSCDFMNLTFCGAQPGNLVGSYWYNWPVSQWGARLKASIGSIAYVELGAFVVDPNELPVRYALDFGNPPGATGALVPIEFAWLPTLAQRLEGSYKFGAWYNTSNTDDVVDNTVGEPLAVDGGRPLVRHGAYGEYINFLQRVSGSARTTQGMSLFLNATATDRRTADLDKQVTLGLFDRGLFPSRPADKLGLALGGTHVNGRVAAAESLENARDSTHVAVQSTEYVAEVFYGAAVFPWLELRPNVQYVRHPGGTSTNTDDVIVGVKLSATF
jgi:porin